MEVIILGSGTCIPSLRRRASGILVKIAGKIILIDSGPGILYRLLEVDILPQQVDILCFTHTHPDHIADLAPFLFACKYALSPRRKNLLIIGGSGFFNYFKGLTKLYNSWLLSKDYTLQISEETYFDFKTFSIRTKSLDHNPESVGFRIESEDGRTIVFSGDTDYCSNLVALAKGADILVAECSFPDEYKVEGHLTPSLAAKIAREAGCQKLILTHFYPPCEEVDLTKQCREDYKGEIILAEDLMKITL